MKRFLMLCLVLLCMGTVGQAAAAPFGTFDSGKTLEENLATSHPDAKFINFYNPGILNQGFYFQAIFASDSVISAGSKFFTVNNNGHSFGDWSQNSAHENIAGMSLSYDGKSYAFNKIVSDIQLYNGSGITYVPGTGLDTMLVGGGTFFVSFSIPTSGNVVDFVLALSSNSIAFEPAHTPAPAALILFGTGVAGILAARKKARN